MSEPCSHEWNASASLADDRTPELGRVWQCARCKGLYYQDNRSPLRPNARTAPTKVPPKYGQQVITRSVIR